MNRIEAVIFDLEGTLFDCPQLSKRHFETIIGLIGSEKSISFREAERLFFSVRSNLSARLGYEPATVTTVVTLGIDREEFFRCIESIEISPFVRSDNRLKRLMTEIRELCKVGLLTNVSRKTAIAILKALGIDAESFDAIVSGDEVLRNKPALDPFCKIAAILNVDPSGTVMVGDRTAIDLTPAKRLGMTTILVGKSFAHSASVDFVIDDIAKVYSTISQIERFEGSNKRSCYWNLKTLN